MFKALANSVSRTFVNQIVNFVMIGLALYGLALFYTAVSHDPIIKHTVKCKYCRQRINQKVGVDFIVARHWLTPYSANDAFIAQVGLMVERSVFTSKDHAHLDAT